MKENKTKKTIYSILALISSIGSIPLRAFVYFKVYYWLVYPVINFDIEKWKLFGLTLALSFFLSDNASSYLLGKKIGESEQKELDRLSYSITYSIIVPLFSLLIAKIFHLFIY